MRYFMLLFMLVLLCGCTATVTKSELNAKASEQDGNSFPDRTYYCGSEDGYDYFVIRRGLGNSTHQYRVAESEKAVTNRFPLTKDEKLWRGYHIV